MRAQAIEDGPQGWEGLRHAWASRPLACGALGLALGLFAGRHLGLPWAGPLALGLGALGALLWQLAQENPRRLGLWLALAGLSLGWARVQPLRQRLDAPPAPDRPALRLEARILSDEGARPADRRHIFRVEALDLRGLDEGPAGRPHGWLRLSVDQEAAQGWGPGDRIEAYGTLREPGPPSNPGEFDYRRHLLGRGGAGSFSARQAWPARRLAAGGPGLERGLWRARQALTRGLDAGLGERALVLARGIVLGDKAGFTREDLSEYARSGFADILAVSGAHFTLALGLGLLVAGAFTHSRRKRAAFGLALGLAYALLTGFEAPVQRAFALFALWLAARLLDWECEAPSSLAAGALAILLAQPGALWEAGFQLSFACTAAVLLLGPALARELPARWPRWLRLGLGASVAAQLALMPLLAWHFHQLSWPSLLACAVSGLFPAGILGLGLPLALLGAWAPGAALLLGWPLERLLLLLDSLAGRMARWPWAAYSTGTLPPWLPALFVLWALAALFYSGPWRRRGLALGAGALLLGLLWQGLPWRQRHPGETRVWMLDVGQGDSFIVRFEDGRTLLVDGGPARPDAGAWTVLPALRALGVQRLSWALATHADADHVGGLAWVLDQLPVGELLHNGQVHDSDAWRALVQAARMRGVPMRPLGAHLPRRPGDGPWRVLYPLPPPSPFRKDGSPRKARKRGKPKRPDSNAASVVLRIEDWLLLTGDLPKAGEKKLLKRGLQPVEVLKAGHHGSRGSSGPAFVGRLRPEHALLSCGADNWYGHPSAPAMAALAGATLWRTDLQGCVALRKRSGAPVEIRPWRPAEREALARPRGPYRSPWRGSEALRRAAWRRAQAPPQAEKGLENGAQAGTDEDGDAA